MAPGTSPEHYVTAEPFDGNPLTTDAEMFDYMRRHLVEQPALSLGGPSIRWVHEALVEMRMLARHPAPDLPCVTFLGSAEKIVDPLRIKARMANWPRGELDMIPGAEHEVMMEGPEMRKRIFDKATALFDAHGDVSGDNANVA
jgi:lysophospholipase